MALESPVNYIDDLVITNPVGTDTLDSGDNHIRNIKKAVKASFPNLGSVAVTATATEINEISGKSEKLDNLISVADYGAVGDGVTDDTAAIQDALDAAFASVPARSTQPDGALGYDYGGASVYLPQGEYLVTATIEVPNNVHFYGDGKRQSVIISAYNGQIVRSSYVPGSYPYTSKSNSITDMRITGDRTKASQIGLDILRWGFGCTLERVEVNNCGSDGIIMRECIGLNVFSCESSANIGDGFFLDEGIADWTAIGTGNGNPSNACTINGCIASINDGPGLRINNSNGNFITGGFYQYSYYTAGNNVGYNILIQGESRQNVINGVWCEGPCMSHIYQILTGTSTVTGNTVINPTMIADGATGFVDRAVICSRGQIHIYNMIGNNAPFKTIGGSNAPFQCNKANTGRIYYQGSDHNGTSVNGFLIEDESNLDYGLNAYANAHVISASKKKTYGTTENYSESGAVAQGWYKVDAAGTGWDSQPYFSLVSNASRPYAAFGDGTLAPDAFLFRSGVGILSIDSGTNIGIVQATFEATTAEIQDIGDTVNTEAKFAGRMIRNSTTGKMLFASASAAAAHWYTADGVDTHIPV